MSYQNQTNQVKQFYSEEFGSLDVLIIDGKPYFPATECAVILGYSKLHNAVERHCRYSLKRGVPHPQSPDKIIELNFIPEGDLYRLIIRSKLASAERFESFVFDTVLPGIRKFGAFIEQGTLEEMVANPEFTAALLEQLQREQELNAKLTPKANYYDRILKSKTAVPVSLIAKDYGYSAVKFNLLLHDLGIQYKIAGTWLLYQEYAGKGYTQTRTYHYGEEASALHTCWTQRGRLFLYDYLLEFGIIPLALFLDEAEDIFDAEFFEVDDVEFEEAGV
ncbi:MAG: phage antirepressor KilAC domain-containing protein [Defluviitaleaceae bacterium]|nr:phage antirepressor KilAC domain-containing protein [Defluviitaleaceae bacterium]